MEAIAGIPTNIVFKADHTDKNGKLVVTTRNRTSNEKNAFMLMHIDSLWCGLDDYDTWRVKYCESHRQEKLLNTFRCGVLDLNTIEYSIKLKLREVK